MVETEAALPGTVHEAAALDDHVPPLVVWRSKIVIFLAAMEAVLRIRDVYPGSRIRLFSIPDPNCLHPGTRILINEIKYFNPNKTKKLFLSSKKYDLGCSSRISDPDADFLPIPDPGSRGQKGIRSRIRNTAWRVRLSLVILATPAGP
jgi:hypothetical protein